MLAQAFANRIGSSPKAAVVNIVVVANAFIWYFYAFSFIMNVIKEVGVGFSYTNVLMIWGINILGIAASAVISASLIYRFNRRVTFILYWMFAGVILSLIPAIIDITSFVNLITISAAIGVYFGLGMPICMGYYAATTEVWNRSRLGGITFLTIFAGFFILTALGIESFTLSAMVLVICKAIGLIILVFLKPSEKQIAANAKVSYGFVIKNRAFLLYFIPWSMFSLVNYMAIPIVNKYISGNLVSYSGTIENILAGIIAVICGFFADAVGRKHLAVAGFTLLGLGYACLGLVPKSDFGGWFYIITDGIAWGIFYTIFLITIWGDISQERSSEKYYALGSLPFLFSVFIRLSVGTYVTADISESAVFSFASVFLFLAVFPLINAPETLPEKHIRERELKNYLEKAQKVKEKYS